MEPDFCVIPWVHYKDSEPDFVSDSELPMKILFVGLEEDSL
jgi:hypothetical protein